MKTITLICICLFTISGVFAQKNSYESIVDTIKQWNVHQKDYWNWDPSPEFLERENTVAERFRGDTVIDNNHYAFLETCTNDSTFTNWQRTPFLFREDTLSGKVYCYKYSNEYLLFDFSLDVGDTLFSDNGDPRIISSVFIEFVGGKERKVLYSETWCGDGTMVEGIGTYTGLQDAALGCRTGMSIYSSLMCYSENGEVLYQDGDVCYIEKEYYKSIVDTTKQWNLHQYEYWFCADSLLYERTIAQRFRSDTVINGKKYKVLETCTNDSTFSNWAVTDMYFREDSSKAKLYCYLDGRESLVSDFSLNVGDTLFSYNREDRVVDSIKRVFMAGKYRRFMYFSGHGTWIEGVGTSEGFVNVAYGELTGQNIWDYLMCYYENGEMLYREDDFCFIYKDHTNNIGEHAAYDISLFPNPVMDELSVTINEYLDNGLLSIYSIDGKKLLSEPIHQGEQAIKLNHLENGLYIATVENNGKVILTERIILDKE